MRLRWAIIFSCVLIFVVGAMWRIFHPIQRKNPNWTVQTMSDETFSIEASGLKTGFLIPVDANWLPIVQIRAQFPVSVSYIAARDEVLVYQRNLRLTTYCAQTHVRTINLQCRLNSPLESYVLVIRDERVPGSDQPKNEIHVVTKGVACWSGTACKHDN